MIRLRRALTVIDRKLIEVRRQDGRGVVQIAVALERSPSVISGELARHSTCRTRKTTPPTCRICSPERIRRD